MPAEEIIVEVTEVVEEVVVEITMGISTILVNPLTMNGDGVTTPLDPIAGAGDMLKATYDPNNIGGDVFDYGNIQNPPSIPTNTSDLNNDSGFITFAAIAGKEDASNKSLNVNADQASNTKYPSVKAVYDWATGLFQTISGLSASVLSIISANVASIKTALGINNIDNTSDANKPVSTATQTALNLKYDASNPLGFISNIIGIAAGGELSGTYPNPAVLNSAILAKVLTGLNVSGSTISATDSILQAFGKIQNQINGVLGGAIYISTWAPSTNTPALADGAGTKGNYYVAVDNAVVNFGSGNVDFHTGDWAIYNGSIWQKVDNTDAVSSVNGYLGAVNLTSADISEVTNLYFTTARVLATALTGYVSGAGIISASDTILQAIQKLNGNIAALVTGVSSVNGATGAVTGLESTSNKSTSVVTDQTSNTKYPSVKAVFDWVVAFFVPTSRNITINGTTQDLSADRTFTVTAGLTLEDIEFLA